MTSLPDHWIEGLKESDPDAYENTKQYLSNSQTAVNSPHITPPQLIPFTTPYGMNWTTSQPHPSSMEMTTQSLMPMNHNAFKSPQGTELVLAI